VGDGRFDPAEELASWARMTRESMDAGFTGLRTFGDMTARVADPARRAEHVRFEHLADRFCLGHPYTALCAYNSSQLGDAVVAELACVHRLVRGQRSPFQLYAHPHADVALTGAVDALSAPQLLQAVQRIGLLSAGRRAVIDAAELEFIDHRTLVTLDQYALSRRATVVLRSPPAIVPRLTDLIPLQAVRLEEDHP
jgi:anti-anti-sigma regulatory factor